MIGSTELYNALNVSAITSLLDSFLTGKALFDEVVIPQSFTGSNSINFYMIGPLNGSLSYNEYSYSISCRSNDYYNSRNIANTVYETINRVHYNRYIIYTQILPTIPPFDDTDNYNTPVEVIIKQAK